MTDAFTKLFAQMMASGQEMARAFNPALEHFDMRLNTSYMNTFEDTRVMLGR